MHQIIVVDDEPMICDVVSDALSEEGAVVRCVTSGEAYVDLLSVQVFDLALIDVMLPGQSGIELAALAANQNTPSLLMSGHPDATAKLRKFGFPHLTKPFSIKALIASSEQAMTESVKNLTQVAAALARMQVAREGLQEAIVESRRLVIESRRIVAGITDPV